VIGVGKVRFTSTGFWIATVIGTGIFYIGAGLGHVYEMVAFGNYSPNNAGPVMYMDLFYPFFLAGLLILYYTRKERRLTRHE
jgi:hypothetical protein